MEKVIAAEQGGAPTLWIANHLFQRDPVALAAAALAGTTKLRVALMAVSPFTVHPVQAAMAAATLDEMFPGRVILCLGVGAPADLRSVAIGVKQPVAAMREAILVVRALLAGEEVHIAGEHFKVHGRRLAAGRPTIPLVLAASGPRMLELAGAEADGVLISAGTSAEFVCWTLDHVRRGAMGRTLRTYALVYSAIDDDETRAHDRLRQALAIVLRGPHHAENLQRGGSVLDQGALNEAVLAQDFARAHIMITDDIVRRHAASGTAMQVRARFAEYRAAGLDEIVVAGAPDGAQIRKILQAA